jgi:predicted metal-dependent enzyme (double-stranded beta helix superfamily)
MAAGYARILADVMGDRDFCRAMERFASAFAAYRNRLPSVAHAYSRTRLAITPGFEIVAMNWAPQSLSPIHDHGDSRCWVLMLEGRLDVQNYACDAADVATGVARLRETERLALNAGDVDHRLGPTELHQVRNPSNERSAFSLQLYARPLSTYSVVDARSHARRLVTAVCDLDLCNVVATT